MSPRRQSPSTTRPIPKKAAFKHLKLKKLAPADDTNCNARFPKAMNNPNWRQKRAEGQGGGGLSVPASQIDITGRENIRLPSAMTKVEFQNIPAGVKECHGDLHELKPHMRMSPQLQHPPNFINVFEAVLQPNQRNLCQILKDTELPFQSYLDARLHLFHIGLIDKTQAPSNGYGRHYSDLGSIRRIEAQPRFPRHLPHTDISWEQDAISFPAMDVTESVEQQSLTPETKYETRFIEIGPSSFGNHSCRNETTRDALVRHLSKTHQSNTSTIGGKALRLSSKQSRDAAFEKMLKKLHSSTSSHQAHRVSITSSKDGSVSPKNRIKTEDRCFFEVRKPISGSGRRCATLSDNLVDYGFTSSAHAAKDAMHGLSVRAGAPIALKSLNPRAREFLSFAAPHPPVKWNAMAKPVIDHPTTTSASTAARLVASERVLPTTHDKECFDSTTLLPNPSITVNSQPYHELGPSPAPLASVKQTLDHTNDLRLPQLAHAFLPTASGVHVVPTVFLTSYKTGLGSIQTGFPPTLSFQFPQPAISASQCPRPVPKPRIPNASSQQAYEAWIEWRKANEPGYAMECKQRQQRRSQRFKAAGSQPDSRVPTTA